MVLAPSDTDTYLTLIEDATGNDKKVKCPTAVHKDSLKVLARRTVAVVLDVRKYTVWVEDFYFVGSLEEMHVAIAARDNPARPIPLTGEELQVVGSDPALPRSAPVIETDPLPKPLKTVPPNPHTAGTVKIKPPDVVVVSPSEIWPVPPRDMTKEQIDALPRERKVTAPDGKTIPFDLMVVQAANIAAEQKIYRLEEAQSVLSKENAGFATRISDLQNDLEAANKTHEEFKQQQETEKLNLTAELATARRIHTEEITQLNREKEGLKNKNGLYLVGGGVVALVALLAAVLASRGYHREIVRLRSLPSGGAVRSRGNLPPPRP
ncbi:MAG: hypothetical protein RJB39_134 [Candidatus Parcubacteria bacterium]